jgi:hypothetical protein
VSFDRSSRTARGRVYQAAVGRYRKRRTSPRPDAPGVWEDPAPDWVWQLCEGILEHCAQEPDAGRLLLEEALAWCEAGPRAPARAAGLLGLLKVPAGIPPLGGLRAFLGRAWRGVA